MYKLILLNMLVANKTTSHTIPQIYLYTSFASRRVKKGLVVVVVTVRRRHITPSTPSTLSMAPSKTKKTGAAAAAPVIVHDDDDLIQVRTTAR